MTEDAIINNIVTSALQQAIIRVLEETTSPLPIGTEVGHVAFVESLNDKRLAGIIVSYNDDSSMATVDIAGHLVQLPPQGMVDLKKMEAYAEELIDDAMDVAAKFIETEFGIKQGEVNPGCTCGHCSTFTPEEHEEQRRTIAIRKFNAEVPKDTSIN